MNMRYSLLLVMVTLLILGVASCTRSASGPPAQVIIGTPTPSFTEEAIPGPDEVMDQLGQIATQTEMARLGTLQPPSGGVAETETSPALQETPLATEAVEQPLASPTPLPTQPPPEPPTATNVIVPTATPGIPSSYTIQGGEFPFCIARRFNLNPTELLNLNGLGPNTVVRPGTTLKIPQTGNPFPGQRALRPHPTTYTVQSGDTIFVVACYFGDVDPYAIAFANGLSAPYRLAVGQTIQIP